MNFHDKLRSFKVAPGYVVGQMPPLEMCEAMSASLAGAIIGLRRMRADSIRCMRERERRYRGGKRVYE